MSLHPLSEADTNCIRDQLNEIEIEHRDLDLVIAHMLENPPPDELLVRRLKKRMQQRLGDNCSSTRVSLRPTPCLVRRVTCRRKGSPIDCRKAWE